MIIASQRCSSVKKLPKVSSVALWYNEAPVDSKRSCVSRVEDEAVEFVPQNEDIEGIDVLVNEPASFAARSEVNVTARDPHLRAFLSLI